MRLPPPPVLCKLMETFDINKLADFIYSREIIKDISTIGISPCILKSK